MEALVVVETILLILIGLLVVGLLRSHAEILRRLESTEAPAASGRDRPDANSLPVPVRAQGASASEIAGATLRGDPVKVAVRTPRANTLIAFLSTGCATCTTFWDGLRPAVRPEIPGGARLVIVTKDSAYESPSRLRELAPPDVPLVMSSDAWDAYEVPGSPYFVYVEGASGTIRGEGMAQGWAQVFSLLRDALADAELTVGWGQDQGGGGRLDDGTAESLSRIDRELLAAGIGEGHASLYSPFGETPGNGSTGPDPERGSPGR